MRLTSIRLAGFKSFVEPTTLALESNLSGVVGPNGCGKSNVIDAVRWVTGESSARQLRGEALEDVIFNGSKTRKPVGRASVELKFDNSDGRLGGEYSGFGDISIKRELVREGGSRYSINGSRARRRDVVDLFLGTGLGGRSNYAVIEQGAVNRLIEAKPEELRQVLEEAAGISKYKERRRETENRIRHTRDNLARMDDLVAEVEQRLAVLKRQAGDAEKYKQLKAEDRRLSAELLALRWSGHNKALAQARTRLDEYETALSNAVDAQHQARSERDEQTSAQQNAMTRVQAHQAALYDAQAQVSRLEQQRAHAREIQALHMREREELVGRIDQTAQREADEQARAKQIDHDLARSHDDYTAAERVSQQQYRALEAAEQAAQAAETAWDKHNSGGRNPVQQLDAERTRARYSQQQLEQVSARRDKRARQRDELGEEDATLLQTAEAEITDHEQCLAADDQALREAAGHHNDLRQREDAAETALAEQRTALAENEARLASDRKLQQSVLREDDDTARPWLGEQGYADASGVARHVRLRDEWQTAAESVLAPWLGGFVVEHLPEEVIAWPEQSLMLVARSSGEHAPTLPEGPGGMPCLAEGMSAPAAVLAAATRFFVADDLDQALTHRLALDDEQWLVTLDGACIGRASMATPAGDSMAAGVLERQRRIEHLAETVARQQQAFEADQQSLAETRQQQNEYGEHRQMLEKRAGERRQALESARARHEGEALRHEQRQARRAELDSELAQLDEQIADIQAERQHQQARIAALEAEAAQYEHDRAIASDELANARSERDRARSQNTQAERALRDSHTRQQQLSQQSQACASRLAELAETRAELESRLAALDTQPTGDTTQAPEAAEHQAAEQAQSEAERALRGARNTLEASEDALKRQGQVLMNAERDVENTRESLQQARVDAEAAGARRAGVAERLEELGETPDELLEQLPDTAEPERWAADIETVQRKIQRLGAINLAAIAEYDSQAEREAYLREQHADLTHALETLEAAIARIDRESRACLKTTFETIDARFSRLFPELFGGGEAALELTENDWLTSGVRIMARPPGKRNASIQMLSGGEKALAAVALLFALFEYNPAPFCILDEIDAPLDDANVARFCELVKRMSAQVQFIVITHNKLTMSLAAQLHGVTMAEPGVSRLVSVDIDQALDMAS